MKKRTLPLLILAGLAALLAAHVLNICLAQSSNEDPPPYAPGRYHPLRFPDAPPLPFRPPGWPLIKVGEGIYIYDNRGVNPLADLLEAAAPLEGGQMLLSGFSESGPRLPAPSCSTTNGTTNFTCAEGAGRFWLKPDSASGTGEPGSEGRRIEIGRQGGNGWWALYLNRTGANLLCSAETNGLGRNYSSAGIGWQSCDWVQIVLNYTPTNTALYTPRLIQGTA